MVDLNSFQTHNISPRTHDILNENEAKLTRFYTLPPESNQGSLLQQHHLDGLGVLGRHQSGDVNTGGHRPPSIGLSTFKPLST